MRIVFMAFLLTVASIAFAGVSSIKSNGKISGVPSYWVQCTNGNDYIIYYKNGSWYRGDILHMGNKFNSWSKEKVAKYVCK